MSAIRPYQRHPWHPRPWKVPLATYLGAQPCLPDQTHNPVPLPHTLPGGLPCVPWVHGLELVIGSDWEAARTRGGMVASVYRADYAIAVHPDMRGRGLAVEHLVWRELNRGHDPAGPRIPRRSPMWGVTRKMHYEIVRRALESGENVPPFVLADYPALA